MASVTVVITKRPELSPILFLVAEARAIDIARRWRSDDVLHCPAEFFVQRGVLQHIRSDNGLEFAAKAVYYWLQRLGVRTLFIEPVSL